MTSGEVLVDRLQPADVIVGVRDEMDVDGVGVLVALLVRVLHLALVASLLKDVVLVVRIGTRKTCE